MRDNDDPPKFVPAGIRILTTGDDCPLLPIVERAGSAKAVVWPAVGALNRTMHLIELQDNGRTRITAHPGEAVYYVKSGTGNVDDGRQSKKPALVEGAMVHIGPNSGYRFEADAVGMTLIGGPCPPDPALYGEGLAPANVDAQADSSSIRIFHRDHPDIRLPLISRDARFVVWPGTGAEFANMNYVVMEPGEANVPHAHKESEDTIFILEGAGTVIDFDRNETFEFKENEAIHVAAGVKHSVRADRGVRVISVGGPCPPDIDLLRMAGVWPRPKPEQPEGAA